MIIRWWLFFQTYGGLPLNGSDLLDLILVQFLSLKHFSFQVILLLQSRNIDISEFIWFQGLWGFSEGLHAYLVVFILRGSELRLESKLRFLLGLLFFFVFFNHGTVYLIVYLIDYLNAILWLPKFWILGFPKLCLPKFWILRFSGLCIFDRTYKLN